MNDNTTIEESEDEVEEGQEPDIMFSDKENASGSPISDGIPKEQRHLRTQAYDKSISDVVSMMSDGDIVLDPDYQRNYVWDNKKASLLVESILLNVPIPVIYVAEDADSRWNVVDGLQRLNSLARFFNNEFKLRGLEVLDELNGSPYSTLNPKAARILRNGILRIILIFKESHPEIKYEIFMRLNRGAIKLTEQELRNCLYRGPFNSLLKQLKKNPKFLEILGLKKPHKRMHDEELILRYFTISDSFDAATNELRNYIGKMKGALNAYMEDRRNMTVKETMEYSLRFEETIDKVYAVFGANAFRKINVDGSFENRPNRAIMDMIMASFEKKPKAALEAHKDQIRTLLRDLPAEDQLFNAAIALSTSDKKNVEYRLITWQRRLAQVLE